MTTATSTSTATRPDSGNRGGRGNRGGKPRAERTNLRTWAFDSAGNRKYAVQIQKASNGNPCLRLVEGVPQPDGTFRKFNLTIWSEDFQRLFETLDEARSYMEENNIRTPEGHKWTPGKGRSKSKAASASQAELTACA